MATIDRWNRDELERSDLGFVEDLHQEDKTALVVFAGLVVGDSAIAEHPHFEFFNVASGLPVSKIFVRDLDQAWYQKGVHGLGASVPETRDALAARLERFEHVVFLGGSSGGYAALLFGALIGVDCALAFAPQTFVKRGLRFLHRDRRWATQIDDMYRGTGVDARYFDLKPILRAAATRTSFSIHYGSRNRLDSVHARRVRRLPGVTIHAHDTGSHGVHRRMRDSGLLNRVLRDAMGLTAEDPV